MCANTERLLDIFDDAGVRATFFVLGWVAERFPTLVAAIAAAGHEIASHGYAHRLVYDQTPAAFREDVRRAKALLEDASRAAGARAIARRATRSRRGRCGRSTCSIEEGYRYDASIFPIRHDRYGIPLVAASSVRADSGQADRSSRCRRRRRPFGPLNLPIAGGGYFRLLPYAWTRWGIERVNRLERRPAVFYLHPWEIDPDQPRLRTGAVSRFRHYRNLDQTEARLRQLLKDFQFGPLGALVNQRDIRSRPRGPALGASVPLVVRHGRSRS